MKPNRFGKISFVFLFAHFKCKCVCALHYPKLMYSVRSTLSDQMANLRYIVKVTCVALNGRSILKYDCNGTRRSITRTNTHKTLYAIKITVGMQWISERVCWEAHTHSKGKTAVNTLTTKQSKIHEIHEFRHLYAMIHELFYYVTKLFQPIGKMATMTISPFPEITVKCMRDKTKHNSYAIHSLSQKEIIVYFTRLSHKYLQVDNKIQRKFGIQSWKIKFQFFVLSCLHFIFKWTSCRCSGIYYYNQFAINFLWFIAKMDNISFTFVELIDWKMCREH